MWMKSTYIVIPLQNVSYEQYFHRVSFNKKLEKS